MDAMIHTLRTEYAELTRDLKQVSDDGHNAPHSLETDILESRAQTVKYLLDRLEWTKLSGSLVSIPAHG